MKDIFSKKLLLLLMVVTMVVFVSACSSTDKEPTVTKIEETIKEDLPKTKDYTADNAYTWLKESGLIASEVEDATEKFENSEGLVKALKTDEADIFEYEKDEYAAKYHKPSLNSYAVKNIYILIKKGQDNADNFVKVLEAGKPLLDLQTSYASKEQKKVAELMTTNSDFLPVVEAYFALTKDQKSSTWDSFMSKKIVTWSGSIADLDAIGDSIVIFGGENYNGEDWAAISTEKKEMLPYTFIVELKDKTIKNDLKKGDKVKLKASLDSRGDKEMLLNWKLYEGEVVK